MENFPRPDELNKFASVCDMLRLAVAQSPDLPAISFDDRQFSYREYGRCVAGLANELTRLDVIGERVVLVLPNSPELAFAVFASLFAAAQATLFNPAYPLAELLPILEDADPKVIITVAPLAEKITSAASELANARVLVLDEHNAIDNWRCDAALSLPDSVIDPSALATLLYTGGTTGQPKGVNRSHAELLTQVLAMEVAWPTAIGTEVWLNVAPIFHTYGFFMGCMNPVYRQAHLILMPRFKPEDVVHMIEHYRVTVLGGGPAALYDGILAAQNLDGADLSSLKICAGGGSGFSAQTHRRWQRATGVTIYEAYGMTEVSPITVNTPERKLKIGSVGRPAPLLDVEIVDLDPPGKVLPARAEGEIRVKGPQAFKSYRNRPDATAETIVDNWIYTGDIGYLDEDGDLFIVDRKKDMIIVSGYNVFPREIDEALARHPDVQEVATIGFADERKGEVPFSFVVPVAGTAPSVEALQAYCQTRLVAYKLPRFIRFVDQLPKTAAHKLDRKRLRAMVEVL